MRRLAGAALALLAAGPAMADQQRPSALREIGFDQKLGQRLPLDIMFVDEGGRRVRLGEYFGKRPVVLNLVYYECPMLCTVSLSGFVSALKLLSFTPGREFEVVTISFDPKDTPESVAAKKKAYMTRYERPEAGPGWHFLTGDKAAIDRVTQAVGFRYAWDEDTRQFAHPVGLLILAPDGTIAKYLFGIEYAPKDLRLALVESGEGKIGSPVDQALLYCYRYNPMTGRYSASILTLVRVSGVVTVLAIAGFIWRMLRRERADAKAVPREAL